MIRSPAATGTTDSSVLRPDHTDHGKGEEQMLMHYTEPRRRRINEALQEHLRTDGRRPERLHEAMRYSVLGGGKRLRPLLCVAGAEICGGAMEDVLPTACALEFIHAFSLIH